MSYNQEPMFIITSNVTSRRRIGEYKLRNLIEGFLYAGLVYYLISLIPFVLKVRIIVSLCLCLAVFLLGLLGYKNQSLSEYLFNSIREKMYKHNYHMRSINDEIEKENIIISAGDGESIADKIYKKFKEYKESKEK